MDEDDREPELLVLRRIRRTALRRLEEGDERARLMLEAVEQLIEERGSEPEGKLAAREERRP
jgi:hypothetical protein